MPQSKTDIAADILKRVRWLYVLFLIAGIAIIARVVWIQYGPDGDMLRERATEITFDRRSIPAQRGDILARDGRILATTIPEYEIRMDFMSINMADTTFYREADSLAFHLSRFFGDRSKESYKTFLLNCYANKEKHRYTRIGNRKINYEEQKIIAKFPILRKGKYRGGYIAEHNDKRFMPLGSLARKTVGAVENDTVARDGIESSFNIPLRGNYGNSLMQKISGTFWIPVPDPLNTEPVNGMDVVTTIDVDIQDVAERALKAQLDWGNANWGTVILMETATGEIHAMCNITRKGPGQFAEDYNYAIRSRNEPGSTFKLATLITLIEDGGMRLTDMVDCSSDANRKAWVGRAHITDDHREGIISLKKVFEKSSNIGFARSVYNIYQNDPERFVSFVADKLNFGNRTGIDLPDEIKPDIKRPSDKKRWDRTSLQMMAYGYAFEVTPLQTVTFYNAVANNGTMMKPMLVKEIRNYGETVERFEPEVLNPQICSPSTVRDVREALEGVVDEGTGRVLKNPYYTAAAKTGTAQMVQAHGGYGVPGRRDYLASFVGYFPADDPKYTCIVAIKTKQQPGKTYYGASLAGPVFRAIADRVYASLVSKHDTKYPAITLFPSAAEVKGGLYGTVSEAAETFRVTIPGLAATERWWSPVETQPVTAGASGGQDANDLLYDGFEVPPVVGMGLRDAVYILEQAGFQVRYQGRGRVISQSVKPGTIMTPGTEIILELKP